MNGTTTAKQPVNILLVDDQPSKLLSYEAILASLEENLIWAKSGKEALEQLLKHDVAVVLIDVCMPELDGFELASMIRSHPRFQRTAIILVSAVLVADDDRLKGYDSGAMDYVSVPVVPGVLRAKVGIFAELYRKTEDLQKLNAELERRVQERTAEIEAARQEAERANQLKDEFLAILSHELRTPLNAITGWAHMLRNGGLDAKTQAKAVETIHRSALLQAHLISDLLDVSRIVSGRLRLELKPVNLAATVQTALDTVRPEAESKGVTLNVEVGDAGMLAGDPARLQQVASNLLSNAVKFTPAGGRVQVRLEKHGEQVELLVQDEGPGIPPDFLPYIFERFRQGDASTTRKHQGLGLGLTIVRHLVEMHGGNIRAMNRADRSGAVFKVTFTQTGLLPEVNSRPALAVAQPATPVESTAASPLESVRVLVVDDEPDAREVAAALLERAGAEVTVAASAPHAFTVFERERPQVLVVDIEMPGEDGCSFIRGVRGLSAERGGQTPALALTAYASDSDRVRLLDAGFDRHLAKPVEPAVLIAALAELAAINGSELLP